MQTSSDVWVSRMATGWGRTVTTPCPEVGGTVQHKVGGTVQQVLSVWPAGGQFHPGQCEKTAAIVAAAMVSRTGFEPALPP